MSGSPSSVRRSRKSDACLPGSPGPACSITCLACWSALFSCGREAPGCGGLSSKSGGIVSGARDSTANSSGNVGSRPIDFLKSLHPVISNGPAKHRVLQAISPRPAPRTRSSLDMVDPLPVTYLMRFPPQKQAIEQHHRDANADGAVGNIKCGPMPKSDVKIEKINHGAEPNSVDDIADGAADYQADRYRQQ